MPAKLRVTNEAPPKGKFSPPICTRLHIDDAAAEKLRLNHLRVEWLHLDYEVSSCIAAHSDMHVSLLRMADHIYHDRVYPENRFEIDHCWLVLWNRRDVIPEVGGERQTADGCPIFQRLGLVELRSMHADENATRVEKEDRMTVVIE